MANQVVKISPVDNTFNVSLAPTLVWDKTIDTPLEPKTNLILSKFADFSNPIIDALLNTQEEYVAEKNILEPNTEYYWGVRLEGDVIDPSPWKLTTAPSVPIISSPLFATDIPLSPTINLIDDVDFGEYEVVLSVNPDFSGIEGDDKWSYRFSGKSYNVPAILPSNTKIYIRARANDLTSFSEWTNGGEYFTTSFGLPESPILISPIPGADNIEKAQTFEWQGGDGATSYIIYLDTSNTFSNPYTQIITGVKEYQFPAELLSFSTQYYWKVISKNASGEVDSGYSTFETKDGDVPDAPILISPNGLQDTNAPQYSWELPIFGSSNGVYQLQVATDIGFSNLVLDHQLSGINSSYDQPTALDYGTTYYWRLRLIQDSAGSAWSNVFEFETVSSQTGTVPSDTSWIYPTASDDIPVDLKFKWEPSVGASAYEFKLYDDHGNVVLALSTVDPEYQLQNGFELEYGREYRAVVIAVNEYGTSRSSLVTFTTINSLELTPPVIVYPSNNQNDVPNIFTASWEIDEDLWDNPTFRLQISEEDSFNTPILDETNIQVTEFPINLDDISNLGIFWMRVMALSQSGNSNWSSVVKFTKLSTSLPSKPVIVTPINGAENVSLPVYVSWTIGNNVIKNQIQISTISTFNNGTIVFQKVQGASANNYNVSDSLLEDGEEYFIRVRSFNISGYGDWSDVVSFTTDIGFQLPAFVKLLKPNNAAVNVQLDPLFEWVPAQYADTYLLQIFLNPPGDGSYILYEVAELTGTTHQLPVDILSKDTRYWWKVVGVNTNGISSTGEYYGFTTINDSAPKKPTIINPTDFSGNISLEPVFAWKETLASSADKYKLEISTDPDFANWVFKSNTIRGLEFDYNNRENNDPEIVNDLEHDTRYYVRVRGIKQNNISGEWSDVVTFITGRIPAPLKPIVTSPIHGDEVENNFKIEFTAALYASRYVIEISETASFQTTVVNRTIEDFSLFVYLLKNKTYYLRIHGEGDGGYGQYTETIKFKTI